MNEHGMDRRGALGVLGGLGLAYEKLVARFENELTA